LPVFTPPVFYFAGFSGPHQRKHFRRRLLDGMEELRRQKVGAMRTFRVVRNVLGTAGLILAGYIFLTSLKDFRRYIKISTM
jgi:hypothetical protein